MDDKIILGNLEGMGYTKESGKERKFTNKVIPIEMVDPESGESFSIDFFDGAVGYRDYGHLPEGFLIGEFNKSETRQSQIKEEEKWEEERGHYNYPDHWKQIYPELSTHIYLRNYDGSPTKEYIRFANPEYVKFKEASFLSLIKALDYNRKKGLKAGNKTIQFPMTHPCRANDPKVFGKFELGDFVSIPVSDEPYTFFQYQRVKYSKSPKKIYVILDGPEPKNNPERAKYLIAGTSKKDQDEYPEWVKGSLLEPADKEDM